MNNTWMSKYIYITDNKFKKGKIKINESDFSIPSSCDSILMYNYNVKQLKAIAKHYKLKQSGNKCMLTSAIYHYLRLSKHSSIIQRYYRNYLIRRLNKIKGKSLIKRSLATNTDDFLTLDTINNISTDQYISLMSNRHEYGFSIKSLYNIILTSNNPQNPYNRIELSKDSIINVKEFLRLSNLMGIDIDLNIDNCPSNINVKFKIIELFHKIDLLGNYSDHKWFLSLNKDELIKFYKHLYDIWIYRTQLTQQQMINICHPSGKPFENYSNSIFLNNLNVGEIQEVFVTVFYNLLTKAIDRENQKLGAYYILGALTLVCADAADSLSWLHNSFMYN
jgi:hypothetical protein